MRAIILLGAPGSGKGTVAEDLAGSEGLVHLSTGDMLREAIRAGTAVGVQAGAFVARGELAPDEVILDLVRERVERDPAETTYLFDGFPRTVRQADLLNELMKTKNGRVDRAILLEVSQDTVIRRIAGRRVCRKCGAVYNVNSKPTRIEGVCDACGGEVVQRPDDNERTVLNRLKVYREQTHDLTDYYAARGLLVTVSAEDREETRRAIVSVLRGVSSGT